MYWFVRGGAMAFDELYLLSTRVAPLDGAAVDRLLTECGLDQPGGYREFMTRFGMGEVCSFLRVRSPDEVREWRQEVGPRLLDESLWEVEAEDWTPWGVSFEQFRGGIALWSTNQRPSFYVLPGHGPRVFQVEPGEVVCYERGMPDMIPAIARLMFDMSFPYFEPQHPGRERDMFDPHPGLELESFVSAVGERWGQCVRRLHSQQDDYVVNVFARPIQARFSCWREEERHPKRLTHISVTYDVECEGELYGFLKDFVVDLGR
jgi:hypothetical protein